MRNRSIPLLVLAVATLPACAVPLNLSRAHELQPDDFCRPEQLRLAAGASEARLGYGASTFTLANEGATACSLLGYPDVELQDAEGEEVDGVKVEEASGTFFEAMREPGPVEIAPGGQAVFQLSFASAPRGRRDADDCVRVHRIAVRPPPAPGEKIDKDDALIAAVNLRPCDGFLTIGAIRPAR